MIILLQALHLAAVALAQSQSQSSLTIPSSSASNSFFSTDISSSSSSQAPTSTSAWASSPNDTQNAVQSHNDTSIEAIDQWSAYHSEAIFGVPALDFLSPDGEDVTVSSGRPLVMAYYSSWLDSILPPEKVDYSKYDWIDFAFAVLTPTYDLDFPGDTLRGLVYCAHQHNTRVKLSIGGWTGSAHFSSGVGTRDKRALLVQRINAIYHLYNLDGIDIDWEYPGGRGNPGNEQNPSDSANFLEFLKLLKSVLPSTAKITAAATPLPFIDFDGHPMKDVSAFSKVLDWILIMNYDTWGALSPGPNAPLYDACNNSSQPDSSAAAGFNAWTRAKFPANKLVLGLASYGYLSKSSNSHLQTRAETPLARDAAPMSQASIRLVSDEGKDTGSISLRTMMKEGALKQAQKGDEVVGAGGFTVRWDDCSCTPFLTSKSAKQIVPFDNARSIAMKAAFVKRAGMRGVNFFDLQGDMLDYVLVRAARKELGC